MKGRILGGRKESGGSQGLVSGTPVLLRRKRWDGRSKDPEVEVIGSTNSREPSGTYREGVPEGRQARRVLE